MDTLTQIYTEIGPWGLILVAAVFVMLRSRITFEYPRKDKK